MEFSLVMETYLTSRNKKSLYRGEDTTNPYLIIYSMEEDQSMKNFFQSRIPPELLSSNGQVSKQEQKDDEEFSRLKNFEDEVDRMNELAVSDQLEPISYVSSHDATIKLYEPLTNDLNQSHYKVKSSIGLTNMQNYQELGFYANDLKKSFVRDSKSKRDSDNADRLLADDWELERVGEVSASSQKSCKAQPLTIDFSDLSFSDWILEPKSFQSNYCSGICQFSANEVNIYLGVWSLTKVIYSIFVYFLET